MTSGLGTARFSLPEGQAVKMIFFAPCACFWLIHQPLSLACHISVQASTQGRGREGRGGERLARKRYTSTGAGLFCRNNLRTHCTDTWYLVNTWSELFKRSIKLSSEYWAQLFKSWMALSTVHWIILYPVDKC